MKLFIRQAIIFSLIVLCTVYIILRKADGAYDPFYLRFTTPKQSSLILGTSRAAQSIQPAILNSSLNRKDLFNYSFTIFHSPYGQAYFESIVNKIEPSTKNGIFIVTVDPWSISTKSEDPDDENSFSEKNSFISLNNVSQKPNLEYLLKYTTEPFYKILVHEKKPPIFLHPDGWLEGNIAMDSLSKQRRLKEKIKEYEENYLPYYKYSRKRHEYLQKTITFLSQHGKVFILRLPVHPLMLNLDNKLVPDFNEKINKLSSETNAPYWDLTPLGDKVEYTDGNHIYKTSGEKVSRLIAEWIKTREYSLRSED